MDSTIVLTSTIVVLLFGCMPHTSDAAQWVECNCDGVVNMTRWCPTPVVRCPGTCAVAVDRGTGATVRWCDGADVVSCGYAGKTLHKVLPDMFGPGDYEMCSCLRDNCNHDISTLSKMCYCDGVATKTACHAPVVRCSGTCAVAVDRGTGAMVRWCDGKDVASCLYPGGALHQKHPDVFGLGDYDVCTCLGDKCNQDMSTASKMCYCDGLANMTRWCPTPVVQCPGACGVAVDRGTGAKVRWCEGGGVASCVSQGDTLHQIRPDMFGPGDYEVCTCLGDKCNQDMLKMCYCDGVANKTMCLAPVVLCPGSCGVAVDRRTGVTVRWCEGGDDARCLYEGETLHQKHPDYFRPGDYEACTCLGDNCNQDISTASTMCYCDGGVNETSRCAMPVVRCTGSCGVAVDRATGATVRWCERKDVAICWYSGGTLHQNRPDVFGPGDYDACSCSWDKCNQNMTTAGGATGRAAPILIMAMTTTMTILLSSRRIACAGVA